MRPVKMATAWCVVVSWLCVLGCGDSDKLYNVTGTVSYDGKPVPKGLVFFDPKEGGPQGFANIEGGKFSTARAGKGVRGGAYTVRISGFDGKEANEAPFGQPLFNEHQEQRELPKANSEVNFELKKTKK